MNMFTRLIHPTVRGTDLYPMSRLSASGFGAGRHPLRSCTLSPVFSISYRVHCSSFCPRRCGHEEKDEWNDDARRGDHCMGRRSHLAQHRTGPQYQRQLLPSRHQFRGLQLHPPPLDRHGLPGSCHHCLAEELLVCLYE